MLHPIFYGSYDWHSCVHMHWSLARLFNIDAVIRIRAPSPRFDRQFDQGRLARKPPHFDRDGAAHWQRPYGWGARSSCMPTRRVRPPACRALAQALAHWPTGWPTRCSNICRRRRHRCAMAWHSNTSRRLSGAALCIDCGRQRFVQLMIRQTAQKWFTGDRDYALAYDFSGEDFRRQR